MTRFASLALIASALTLMSAAPALAQAVNYTATLSAAEEVPPTTSTGTGMVEAAFDPATMVLTWTVTYEGVTGDATAAHFHGPADPGMNAGPVVAIEGPLASPIMGMATLDATQAADLQAGKWYFNLHTAMFPDGELRGQVAPPPAP